MKPRNFLAYGFGVSVAVHLIVLPFVHPERTASDKEAGPDVVYRTRIPTPPPTPRPTPSPRPTPQPTRPPHEKPHTPAPQHRQRIKIVTIHQGPHKGGGVSEPGNTHPSGDRNGNGVVQNGPTAGPVASVPSASPGAASPAPTPHPTPTPLSCARPNVPAVTVRAAVPDTPALAQQQGISGTVNVVVSLDAQSRIVGTHVQTSPSVVLNQPALVAARGSQFRTEIRNCEPAAADYLFSVEFTAQ